MWPVLAEVQIDYRVMSEHIADFHNQRIPVLVVVFVREDFPRR